MPDVVGWIYLPYNETQRTRTWQITFGFYDIRGSSYVASQRLTCQGWPRFV
jgi:hypothetical protein